MCVCVCARGTYVLVCHEFILPVIVARTTTALLLTLQTFVVLLPAVRHGIHGCYEHKSVGHCALGLTFELCKYEMSNEMSDASSENTPEPLLFFSEYFPIFTRSLPFP